jgi:hypothetical protein
MAISYSPAVNSARIITALGFTPASAGAVVIADGSAAAPGMIYGSDVDTGFYQATPGDGTLSIALGGANMGTFSSTGLSLAGGVNTTKNTGTTNTVLSRLAAAMSGGGTTDSTNVLITTDFTGTGSAFQTVGAKVTLDLNHTAGTVSFALANDGYVRLGLAGSAVSGITSARYSRGHIAHEGTGGTITTAAVFEAGDVDLLDGTGTIGTMTGFQVGNLGHGTRVTTAAYGVSVGNMTEGAPITAAYQSAMASGTGKWGLYFSGTAKSYHAGQIAIGTSVVGTEQVRIRQDSAGATTYGMVLMNAGSTASTGVALSFDPTGNGANSRDGLIRATTNGGNSITFDFLVANGGAPAVTFTIAPALVTSAQNFKIASGKTLTLGNAATTGLVAGALAATTNASIVITDSTGQAYRIPCII